MSQEINLLNPALRPKFNLLTFKPVASVALVILLALGATYAYTSAELERSIKQRQGGERTLGDLQTAVREAQAALAGMRPNPALAAQIEAGEAQLARENDILARVSESTATASGGFADVMRGFSRQIIDGVWLTAFSSNSQGMEIHGRLTNPGLLPTYLERLNGEPAFRGRRFAALDMQDSALRDAAGMQPANARMPPKASAGLPPLSVPFTEFALRASLAPTSGEQAP